MNIIQLARKHVGNGAAMESSARLCLADAIRHHDEGNYHRANVHALKSLAYSVGIVHADYCKAWHAITGNDETRLSGWREFSNAIEADENAPIESVPHYINQLTEMGVTRPLSRAIRVF